MADNSHLTHSPEFAEPWPAHGFNDPWNDPIELRARERRQLRRYQLGFATLGFGLIIASLSNVGFLVALLLGLRPILMQLRSWAFYEETAVVGFTLVGVGLLWGAWPDEHWRRRSGLLLMMFLVDLILWSVEHATTLGLADHPFGHEPFRNALGQALGWSEVALIASLSAGMAATLGESRALDLGRAVRSLATVGASVWFAFFVLRTDWSHPIWPLRERLFNPELIYLALGSAFLSATVLIQVTTLCLYAGRTCGRMVRVLRAEENAGESAWSRSESGWDEYHSQDADRRGH